MASSAAPHLGGSTPRLQEARTSPTSRSTFPDAPARLLRLRAGSEATEHRQGGDRRAQGAQRPSTASGGTITLIEYEADGRGRRTAKYVDGVLEQAWLWREQLQPVAELDGAGNVVAMFVYGDSPNVPELVVTSGATYRLLKDHLGSVRLVVDVDTGAIAQRIDYDAWGNVLADTNPGLQPFGFAGGLYDADTGLVRFGARDYEAATGRWTAKDPIRFEGRDSSLQVYCLNDPVGCSDSSGTIPAEALCKAFVSVVAVGGGVACGVLALPTGELALGLCLTADFALLAWAANNCDPPRYPPPGPGGCIDTNGDGHEDSFDSDGDGAPDSCCA